MSTQTFFAVFIGLAGVVPALLFTGMYLGMLIREGHILSVTDLVGVSILLMGFAGVLLVLKNPKMGGWVALVSGTAGVIASLSERAGYHVLKFVSPVFDFGAILLIASGLTVIIKSCDFVSHFLPFAFSKNLNSFPADIKTGG